MSSFPIPYMAKFCVGASSKQKDSEISKADQKSNTENVVRPLCSSSILHWFYPIRYMATGAEIVSFVSFTLVFD